MKRFGVSAVFVAALVAAGTAGAGDTARKELERFRGTWKVAKAEEGGRPAPDERVQGTRITFAGDKLTMKERDHTEELTIRIDPGKKPATIDFDLGKGKPAIPGIYKFEKDQLVLCFDNDGKARPQAFASPEGSSLSLLFLERTKE
jgi:uncharacterized protein (TIGR03067 family)